MSRYAFMMPGWDAASAWGEDGGYYFAQLYRDTDSDDNPPRVWITPPRARVTSEDDLAALIASEVGREHQPTPTVDQVKAWMRAGARIR